MPLGNIYFYNDIRSEAQFYSNYLIFSYESNSRACVYRLL